MPSSWPRRHDPRVIVEAHGGGKEVECSVLGNEAPRTSPPGEIVAHADWYDYEAKYSEGGMELIVPARIGEAETARVRELAARAFRAIDGSGLARCDFFVRDGGEVLVNELNTIPGFTVHQRVREAVRGRRPAYPELCDRLVRLGVERYEKRARLRVLSASRSTLRGKLDVADRHVVAAVCSGDLGDPEQVVARGLGRP